MIKVYSALKQSSYSKLVLKNLKSTCKIAVDLMFNVYTQHFAVFEKFLKKLDFKSCKQMVQLLKDSKNLKQANQVL